MIVRLGRNVIILKGLLTVESDLFSLDFAIFHVDLVAYQTDWDHIANTSEILVPLGDVLVGDSGGDIEHDDTTLASNVVAVTKTTELLLASSVPHVELDETLVGMEGHRSNFNTNCGVVLFFELTSGVSLDEGGLADTTISYKHELELSDRSS